MKNLGSKSVVVVIPCHNQGDTVTLCIDYLINNGMKPSKILVIDDHSDSGKGPHHDSKLVKIEKASGGKGRSSTRNQGIRSALEMGAEYIIFMDGDTIPSDNDFISDHVRELGASTDPRIVFGMRRHIPRPVDLQGYLRGLPSYASTTCSAPPSDYLTANMDAFFSRSKPTDKDLRLVSGTVSAYNEASTFEEKCDLITSGMVTWSCNFSLTSAAAVSLNKKMIDTYGVDGWFDDTVFNNGWGYEDVALGLDALFAGIDVVLRGNPTVLHFMHDRTDQLHSHIQGRHRIMERYRKLVSIKAQDMLPIGRVDSLVMANGLVASISKKSLMINGRVFDIPSDVRGTRIKHTLTYAFGKMFVDGWKFDMATGVFSKSLVGKILYKLSEG